MAPLAHRVGGIGRSLLKTGYLFWGHGGHSHKAPGKEQKPDTDDDEHLVEYFCIILHVLPFQELISLFISSPIYVFYKNFGFVHQGGYYLVSPKKWDTRKNTQKLMFIFAKFRENIFIFRVFSR